MKFLRCASVNGVEIVTDPDSFLKAHTNKVSVAITGAGISHEFPALVPIVGSGYLSKGLKGILHDLLFNAISPEVEPFARNLEGLFLSLPLEVILAFIVRVAGKEFLSFYDLVTPKVLGAIEPTHTHRCIAELCRRNLIDRVLTFNFDTLQEEAFTSANVSFECPESPNNSHLTEKKAYKRTSRGLCLFKLHGTYPLSNWDRLLATLNDIGSGLPDYKKRAVESSISSRNMLFLGYSDNDFDTFPLFVQAPKSTSIIWFEKFENVVYGDSFSRIREFLSERQHIIVTGELSDFFAYFADRISLSLPSLMQTVGLPDATALNAKSIAVALERDAQIARFERLLTLRFFRNPLNADIVLATIARRYGKNDISDSILRHIQKSETRPPDKRFYFVLAQEMSERERGRLHFAMSSEWERRALSSIQPDPDEQRDIVYESVVRRIAIAARDMRARKANRLKGKRWAGTEKAIASANQLIRVLFFLVTRGSSLRPSQRNTLRGRFLFEVGDYFQFACEEMIFRACKDGQAKRPHGRLPLRARFLAAIAEVLYTAASLTTNMDPDYHGLFKTRCLEMRLHRTARADSSLNSGILDLESKYLFEHGGQANFARSEQYNRLFLVKAWQQCYMNEYARAIRQADEAEGYFSSYEQNTGGAKCILAKAYCYKQLGNTAAANREIERLLDLLKGAD